jgi:hypothetical protein
MNNNWDDLSDLAENLLRKRRFIFKGGEPPSEVSLYSSITIYTILITIDSAQMDDLLTFLLLRRSIHISLRILRAELFSKQIHLSARLRLQLLR